MIFWKITDKIMNSIEISDGKKVVKKICVTTEYNL
jgi:hypothetical protein